MCMHGAYRMCILPSSSEAAKTLPATLSGGGGGGFSERGCDGGTVNFKA